MALRHCRGRRTLCEDSLLSSGRQWVSSLAVLCPGRRRLVATCSGIGRFGDARWGRGTCPVNRGKATAVLVVRKSRVEGERHGKANRRK